MFASLCTRNANALESSPNSDASLIRGVALRRVKRSSRTSFRSFHFDDVRPACSLAGRFGVISTSSTNCRGSGGAGSVPYCSHSLHIISDCQRTFFGCGIAVSSCGILLCISRLLPCHTLRFQSAFPSSFLLHAIPSFLQLFNLNRLEIC